MKVTRTDLFHGNTQLDYPVFFSRYRETHRHEKDSLYRRKDAPS
ncbi:hypothetical protein LTSEURB_6792 [Salmonella enterica subsp. enterica serovar Urbana str. R8-2977]|uniref:Uncharacterized protein n=1 Tax=Salmonella enterica subsp. enterica serovar Urbana str. R8-2977 TaxID=913084 RepID=G5S5I3_SALET|nr:hypothetical protein LTSEURB_6792 [Salmonella enterica subsp. enterica serovar Urbana str. R8-2977]